MSIFQVLNYIMDNHRTLSEIIKEDTHSIIEHTIGCMRKQNEHFIDRLQKTQDTMINNMIEKISDKLMNDTFHYITDGDNDYPCYNESRFDIMYVQCDHNKSDDEHDRTEKRLTNFVMPEIKLRINKVYPDNENIIFRYSVCHRGDSSEYDGTVVLLNVSEMGNIVYGYFDIKSLYLAEKRADIGYIKHTIPFEESDFVTTGEPVVVMNNIKLHPKYIKSIQRLHEHCEKAHYKFINSGEYFYSRTYAGFQSWTQKNVPNSSYANIDLIEFLVSYIQEITKLNKEYCCRFIETFERQREHAMLVASNKEKDKKIEELIAQIKTLVPPSKQCCVCFGRANKKKTLIPCGHRQYCDVCLEKLNGKCAICRTSIENIIGIY